MAVASKFYRAASRHSANDRCHGPQVAGAARFFEKSNDMDTKKLIGLHIDTNALNLTVKTEADAERVLQTLNDAQMRNCRRIKGTNTFSLYSGGLGESLAEYLK